MRDPLAELEQEHRLLRWDKETAIEYMGLGQVQRLDALKQGAGMSLQTPWGMLTAVKVAGEYRIILP